MLIKHPINHQPKALAAGDERFVEWAILQLGDILAEIAKGEEKRQSAECRLGRIIDGGQRKCYQKKE